MILRLAAALLLLAGYASGLRGADLPGVPPHPRGYVACKTARPLTIDGKLDEPAWRAAPWTADFVDIEGNLRPAPRFRTRAKMLWDDTYLYIGAELQEPHVWATLHQRDTVIFIDNDFEVFIDPNGDAHEYYEFEMNANNTVWDLFLPKPYKDSGSAVNSWNIEGLKTAVWVRGTLNDPSDTDSGWCAEIAMPWRALKQYAHRPAPPRNGDQWRINFSRVEWLHEVVAGAYRKVAGHREDNWVWSPQGVVDMHRPEMWGYVQFSTMKQGKEPFRPDPAWGVKSTLQEVYYAERHYRDSTRQWTGSLDQLRLGEAARGARQQGLSLQEAGGGFIVTMPLALPGRPVQHWHIRQDALIWQD